MNDSHISNNHQIRSKYIAGHLKTWFHGIHEGFLTINYRTAGGLRSDWFGVNDTKGAAARAAELASADCVWFSCAPRRERVQGRGGSKDVCALPGLWADVDYEAGEAHKKSKLPSDRNAALSVVKAVGQAPTLIVDSGHGLHVYWQFKEPWVFTKNDEWRQAQDLANDFKALLNAKAGEIGFSVDPVSDLARMLRPAGTLNHKVTVDVRPVSVLGKYEPAARQRHEDFRAAIPVFSPPTGGTRTSVAKSSASPRKKPEGWGARHDLIIQKAKAAKNKKAFTRLWEGQLIDHKNDHSVADLAMCGHLAFWTNGDRESIDVMFRMSGLMRDKWDEIHQSDGRTYGAMTIDKVLEGFDRGYDPEKAGDDKTTLDKNDSLAIARKYVIEKHGHADGATLVYSGDAFHQWEGTHYVEVENAAVRAWVYLWLENCQRIVTDGKQSNVVPFVPTKQDVTNTIDAMEAIRYSEARAPSWLSQRPDLPDPTTLLVAPNGLFELERFHEPAMLPTPLLFSPNALDYEIHPDAPPPTEWLAFLKMIWPDSPDQIATLQEFFGLSLTAVMTYQKILLIVGPPRSGKGTIARVLTAMLGTENVCAPTLAGLGTNFGLMPLIGKRLAIISDARLGSRSDQAVVTERLLSISGEDAITIDRKNRTPLTTRLNTRLLIMSNELPRLTDASGALANRFIPLILEKSFLGKEDLDLEQRLVLERPSILCWALKGWQRLRARRKFLRTKAGLEAISELTDLASPVTTFVRDWCVIAGHQQVPVRDFYTAWCAWCEEQGRQWHGDSARLGRDLRAAVNGISIVQSRTGDGARHRTYAGVGVATGSQQSSDQVSNAALVRHDSRNRCSRKKRFMYPGTRWYGIIFLVWRTAACHKASGRSSLSVGTRWHACQTYDVENEAYFYLRRFLREAYIGIVSSQKRSAIPREPSRAIACRARRTK